MRAAIGLLLTALLGAGCAGDGPPTTPDVPVDAGAPTTPRSSHGTLLYGAGDRVVVQHDDPLGRVVPGTERYALADGVDVSGLVPGDHVDLWVEDGKPLRLVTAVRRTGADALPSTFQVGGWPVVGTVVRVDGARITLDHEAVPGLMDAMVMPFTAGGDVSARFGPGDRVQGRIVTSQYGYHLVELERIGTGSVELREDVPTLVLGKALPRLEVPVEDGSVLVVGEGQDKPTALAFLYTTCPDPSMCPAIALRLGALQGAIGTDARILAVTIDPDRDTAEVLRAYGEAVGADPAIWRFGRLEPVELHRLALRAGLTVTVEGGKISHRLRLLVLDADGRLVERYDDAAWPVARVAEQLRTGGPPAPDGQLGTLSAPP